MNPMLEKIARAARDYMESVNPDEHRADELSLGVARAVLLAIRDPDEAMIEAGEGCCYPDGSGYGEAFTAMIEYVLAEGPQK